MNRLKLTAVNHLQNVTNGIMFPNIPQLWTRRPTLVIPSTPSEHSVEYATFHGGC